MASTGNQSSIAIVTRFLQKLVKYTYLSGLQTELSEPHKNIYSLLQKRLSQNEIAFLESNRSQPI